MSTQVSRSTNRMCTQLLVGLLHMQDAMQKAVVRQCSTALSVEGEQNQAALHKRPN